MKFRNFFRYYNPKKGIISVGFRPTHGRSWIASICVGRVEARNPIPPRRDVASTRPTRKRTFRSDTRYIDSPAKSGIRHFKQLCEF